MTTSEKLFGIVMTGLLSEADEALRKAKLSVQKQFVDDIYNCEKNEHDLVEANAVNSQTGFGHVAFVSQPVPGVVYSGLKPLKIFRDKIEDIAEQLSEGVRL